MPNEELNTALTALGAALGLRPGDGETAAGFARRCTAAADRLRKGAGVTWADYELLKVDSKRVWFALKQLPDDSPLGGPRWAIDVGQGLEQLAVKLGTYEGA